MSPAPNQDCDLKRMMTFEGNPVRMNLNQALSDVENYRRKQCLWVVDFFLKRITMPWLANYCSFSKVLQRCWNLSAFLRNSIDLR